MAKLLGGGALWEVLRSLEVCPVGPLSLPLPLFSLLPSSGNGWFALPHVPIMLCGPYQKPKAMEPLDLELEPLES
jgi:hypothetical protein